MPPDFQMPDATVPSDVVLEETLREIVRDPGFGPIIVNRVRAAAEERLGLEAGFFENSDDWSQKSKDILEDEFNTPSNIIVTLPSEVLGIIVHHCEDDDLANVRLSCKTLSAAATQPFGRRRLAHRRFIFTEYSLQGLVDLTAHPVFSPCVRSISFGTCRLAMDDDGSAYTTTDGPTLDRFLLKQTDFTNSGSQLFMLVKVLRNLTANGNHHVVLGVYDDKCEADLPPASDACYMKGYGFDDAYGPFLPRVHQARNTLVALTNAVALSDFVLQGLCIDLDSSLSPSNALMEDAVIERFLMTSDIDLHVRYSEDLDESWLHAASQDSCLRILHHNLDQDEPTNTVFDEAVYGCIYRALKQTPFKKLIVEDVETSMPGFFESLNGWEKSLRHLKLSAVQVFKFSPDAGYVDDYPIDFFRYIRDVLSLDVLEMEDFTVKDDTHYTENVVSCKKATWRGEDEIREELDAIIAQLQVVNF